MLRVCAVSLALLMSGLGLRAAHAQPTTAEYRVTFESTWSATTHPDGFPSNPHFSGLIGATHDDRVAFWAPGTLASLGIKNMAETGSKAALRDIITPAIDAGTAEHVLDGGSINLSPGQVELTFEITTEYPLVTFVSMLAPSPDWFVGVAGWPLYEDGEWVEGEVVELFTYDAGTDSGTTYIAENKATDPPEPIARIEGGSFLVDDAVRPVGTFTFTRLSVTPTAIDAMDEEVPASYTLSPVYPNPFNPTAAFTLEVGTAQHVRVGLFNLLGHKVLDIFEGTLAAGAEHRFTLNASTLPSGLYLVRAEGEHFRGHRRAVVLK